MRERLAVLGVHLDALTVEEAVARGLEGGLILAPSGPGLCDLPNDPIYRDALIESDVNLTDSAFVQWARLLRGHRFAPRTSGLAYLQALLEEPTLRSPKATFWVMPSETSMRTNLAWLRRRGFEVSEADCYVAPHFPRRGRVIDAGLVAALERSRPGHVFVCIGGGVQEKLGAYLKTTLSYRPGIHCVGAAIGFLSGDQVRIPSWADRAGLGWLVRCASNPRVFVPRYLRAFKLAYLVVRYDGMAPRSSRAHELPETGVTPT
jgi:UDP-N-acetyl-D-mannosaminuronic acid transferase (WecB/TagA/CpsF family)